MCRSTTVTRSPFSASSNPPQCSSFSWRASCAAAGVFFPPPLRAWYYSPSISNLAGSTVMRRWQLYGTCASYRSGVSCSTRHATSTEGSFRYVMSASPLSLPVVWSLGRAGGDWASGGEGKARERGRVVCLFSPSVNQYFVRSLAHSFAHLLIHACMRIAATALVFDHACKVSFHRANLGVPCAALV